MRLGLAIVKVCDLIGLQRLGERLLGRVDLNWLHLEYTLCTHIPHAQHIHRINHKRSMCTNTYIYIYISCVHIHPQRKIHPHTRKPTTRTYINLHIHTHTHTHTHAQTKSRARTRTRTAHTQYKKPLMSSSLTNLKNSQVVRWDRLLPGNTSASVLCKGERGDTGSAPPQGMTTHAWHCTGAGDKEGCAHTPLHSSSLCPPGRG